MGFDASDVRSTEPEVVKTSVRLLGTGASAPTLQFGKNVSISRTGVGAYRLTFVDPPGTYVNFTYGLEATTQSAMFGCTVVGKYTAQSGSTPARLDIALASGGTTPAARELAAAEWIHLVINHKAHA
jgi:hypothetical protein